MDVVLHPLEIVSVATDQLGAKVCSLAAQGIQITDALDELLTLFGRPNVYVEVQRNLRVVDVTGRGVEAPLSAARLHGDLDALLQRVRMAVQADADGGATERRQRAGAGSIDREDRRRTQDAGPVVVCHGS